MNPAIIAALAASTHKAGQATEVHTPKAEFTETSLYGCILAMIVLASFASSAIALLKALS